MADDNKTACAAEALKMRKTVQSEQAVAQGKLQAVAEMMKAADPAAFTRLREMAAMGESACTEADIRSPSQFTALANAAEQGWKK